MKIGQKVKIQEKILGNAFSGRTGILTSIDTRAKMSHHVTLDGETHETDFMLNELQVI